MTIELENFHPDARKAFTTAVVGRRASGKSVLVKDLMYSLHGAGLTRCVVFSGTHEGSQIYRSSVPERDLHIGPLDLATLRQVVTAQIATHTAAAADRKFGIGTRLLIVMDDCDSMFRKTPGSIDILRELHLNNKQWNISLVLTCQYIHLMSPECRCGIDFLMVCPDSSPVSREKLYGTFFTGAFETRTHFYQVLDSCTKDHGCLVLDNTVQHDLLTACVFRYRAEIHMPHFAFEPDTTAGTRQIQCR